VAAAALGAFPQPPRQRTIQLPTGASLTGAVELPKGLDEQCTVAFNLMLQMSPFLASIQCLVQVLQFVQDVIQVARDVPDKLTSLPPDIDGIVRDIGKVVDDGEKLVKCFGWVIPAVPLCAFVKDTLKTVHDFVTCVVDLLDSVMEQQLQIHLRMKDADQEGNQELLDVLRLADDNLTATLGQAMQSMGPVLVLLQLMGSFLEVVGGGALTLPSMDDLAGPDVGQSIQVVKDLNGAIGAVVEVLPC
jgi:hypothetical protein